MAGFWYASGSLLIAFAPPFPAVMAGLVLRGLGGGFYATCLTSVASHYESTKLMNIFYSFFGFGSLVSPFIIGALANAGILWSIHRYFIGFPFPFPSWLLCATFSFLKTTQLRLGLKMKMWNIRVFTEGLNK
ncbi:hypothetical protein B0J17DRAFT_646256 [Rhizoctonia solani]|nr:hypothetical protein B0J17DRAFT_646256 [Rhizoctonia solani]